MTHDQQIDTTSTTNANVETPSGPEFSGQGQTEPSTAQTQPPTAAPDQSSAPRTDSAPPTVDEESSTARPEPSEMESAPASVATEPSSDESLFADNDRSRLRSCWDDVQASFVDDPKECVQNADVLVAQVVEQLTAGFSDARSRLEAQWAQGEEASTEDLRLALQRYREFFQRLLSA